MNKKPERVAREGGGGKKGRSLRKRSQQDQSRVVVLQNKADTITRRVFKIPGGNYRKRKGLGEWRGRKGGSKKGKKISP